MSPRRRSNTITVENWPDLRFRFYPGKILSAGRVKGSRCIRVRIENHDPSQRDRVHEIDMPSPRPGNRTSNFLKACGVEALEVGTRIDLDQLVGLVVEFRPRLRADGEPERFDFKAIPVRSACETPPTTIDTNPRGDDVETSQAVDLSLGGPPSSMAD